MESGHGWLAGDWPSTGGVLNITAAAWTAGLMNMMFHHCLYMNIEHLSTEQWQSL